MAARSVSQLPILTRSTLSQDKLDAVYECVVRPYRGGWTAFRTASRLSQAVTFTKNGAQRCASRRSDRRSHPALDEPGCRSLIGAMLEQPRPPRPADRVKAQRRFSGLTKRLAARDAGPPVAGAPADHGPAEAGHYQDRYSSADAMRVHSASSESVAIGWFARRYR